MLKTLMLASVLAAPSFAAVESDILLKVHGKFHQGKKKQEWKNKIEVEYGKTYVVNEGKNESCTAKGCETEEYKTEITPHLVEEGVVKVDIAFVRRHGQHTNRFNGTIITRIGDSGQLELSSEAPPAVLSIYVAPTPKR